MEKGDESHVVFVCAAYGGSDMEEKKAERWLKVNLPVDSSKHFILSVPRLA